MVFSFVRGWTRRASLQFAGPGREVRDRGGRELLDRQRPFSRELLDRQHTGTFDVEKPSRSSLQLTIEAASIDTANPDRDGHLRSNDFLDLEHYPQITFASTAVAQVEPDTYRVNGDLSIKGVTRPVTFDLVYAGSAVDPYGNQRVGFEGSTTINRKDWGVNWNAALEAGGVLVSEKVTLEFDISAIKDAATAA